MKFVLIDNIVTIQGSEQISAVKSVSLAEEYLGDHFPAFPVLPGVLLLEGLIETASWLVRKVHNFAHSMVLLETARNVKYKSFAAPGMRIQYNIKAKAIEENVSSFAGEGICDGTSIVEARFALRHFNLVEENPRMASLDGQIIEKMKQRWKLLTQNTELE